MCFHGRIGFLRCRGSRPFLPEKAREHRLFPRIFVPIPCSDSGGLFLGVTPEHLFTKIEFLAIHFDFLVKVDVDRTVIGALY